MRDTNKRINELAAKLRQHTITPEERAEFEAWYASFDDTYLEEDSAESAEELKARLYQNILQREDIHQPKPYQLWRRLSVAASVILVLSASSWFMLQKKARQQQAAAMAAIAPGSNKAVLTLANGEQIALNNTQNGNIAQQGNATINKVANGKLTYTAGTAKGTLVYNTITTPNGGQYAVTLADGTRVLLNAASSLKYPVNFTGANRTVELTGEAYFEVVHNATQPFRVKTAGQTIEDIGTQFNINAYADEADTRTTLLEGSVRVTAGANASGVLKPGEQAIQKDGGIKIAPANVDEVVAWKSGYFMFESEDITSIMRKIARWYNVEVVYEGPVPTDKFGGTVNRFGSVAQVLNKLELTDRVHFKVEGRRIMVSR